MEIEEEEIKEVDEMDTVVGPLDAYVSRGVGGRVASEVV